MPTRIRQRATRQEILAHLDRLLGARAQEVVLDATELLCDGKNEQALEILKTYDAQLGGIGLHLHPPQRKLSGPYRALAYIYVPLCSVDVEERTRQIVQHSCGYVEDIVKKMVRLGILEKMRDDLPLGQMLGRIKHKVPQLLFAQLKWLNDEIYVFAKHENDFSDRNEPEPEHYFALDEAIAVYIIARKFVIELSNLTDPAIVESWAHPNS